MFRACVLGGGLLLFPLKAAEVFFSGGGGLVGGLELEGDQLALSVPWQREAMRVPVAALREIRGDGVLMPTGTERVLLRTRGGDQASGRLEEAGEGEVALRTSWGQVLRIRQEHVRSLEFQEEGEMIFDGPGPLAAWKRNGLPKANPKAPPLELAGMWLLPRSVFHAQMPHRLPSTGRVFFDLRIQAPPGSNPGMIQLYPLMGGTHAAELSGHLRFLLNHSFFGGMVPHVGEGSPARNFSHGIQKPFGDLRLRLYFDLRANKAWVFLGQELIRELEIPWLDTVDFQEELRLDFQTNRSNGVALLRHLRMGSWVVNPLHEVTFEADAGKDRLLLRDGRRLEGGWTGFSQGELLFHPTGELQPLRFPTGEVLRLLAASPGETPDVPEAAWLLYAGATGDRYGLRTLRGGGSGFTGESPEWTTPPIIPLTALLQLLSPKAPPDSGESSSTARIRFLTGDHLLGRLVAQEGGACLFQPACGGEALRIPARNVDRLFLWGDGKSLGDSVCGLVLKDGQRWSGEVLSADTEGFLFRSFWGQELRIPLEMLSRVEMSVPTEKTLMVRGGPDAWKTTASKGGGEGNPSTGKREEIYGNQGLGGLRIPASCGLFRKMPGLPDRVTIQLQVVVPRGEVPEFQLSLFTEDVFSRDGMNFCISGNRMIYRLARGGLRDPGWYIEGEGSEAGAGEPMTLRFRFDFEKGRAALSVPGQWEHEWSLPPETMRALRRHPWVVIDALDPGTDLILLDFRVWDGDFPPLDPAVSALDHGVRLLIRNGDSFVGEWRGLDQGRVLFQDALGREFSLPLGRIGTLLFPEGKGFRARRMPRDIELRTLGGRDFLRMELLGIDAGFLTGRMEVSGEPLHIPRENLEEIRFNPHSSIEPPIVPGELDPALEALLRQW